MLDLNHRERLYVDVGSRALGGLDDVDVVLVGHRRVDARDHVHFGDRPVHLLAHLLLDDFRSHQVAALLINLCRERAELARVDADVGVVDVLVDVEEHLPAVLLSLYSLEMPTANHPWLGLRSLATTIGKMDP